MDYKEDDEEDRFSNLPDSIILHILSFLPTKYAVSTSILSTKFKSLWLDLTNLDFDDDLLFNPDVKLQFLYPVTFQNFVESVLIRSSSPTIHKFSLCCSSTVDDMFIVNDWIKNVINRYVQEIELSISSDYSLKLGVEIPKRLFVCKTLVVLKLNLRFDLSIPDFDEDEVWFPNLKVFHMVVHEPREDLEKRLFCNFPVLEDLCVEGSLAADRNVEILASGSRLKRVKLNLWVNWLRNHEYKIVIDGVCLDVIHFSDNFLGCYVISNLISVDTGIVDVGFSNDGFESNSSLNRATELLTRIIMVKSLKLSARTMDTLKFEYNELPTFYNLTRLELFFCKSCHWETLSKLLKCSPSMEVLVLCKDGKHSGILVQDDSCYASDSVPLCLKTHLKVIQYKGFQGGNDEIKMLKYMLKNGEVLSEILVSFCQLTTKDVKKIKKKFKRVHIASQTCKIQLTRLESS